MFNKLYIIVERASVKSQLIWKFSGGDVVIMGIGFLIFFTLGRAIGNELIALVLGSAVFVIIGFLLVEMPNHLSILEHIKKCYRYYFKTPKSFFYIPEEMKRKENDMDEEEEDSEWIEFNINLKGVKKHEK